MPRILPLVAAQSAPRLIGEPIAGFADEVAGILRTCPETRMVIFPELHLFSDGDPDLQRTEALQDSAEPLAGPRTRELQELAGDLDIWLVPGSVCERGPDGQLFNTMMVCSPQGEPAGYYRKIFPWRPHEPYDPGERFTTVDIDGVGRLGLNICYDAWFPEVTRQLAWMGAEVILNVVKTTTPDRRQELVLAQANAIVNQVFMVSVNCAGPVGTGCSLIVDPEGNVITSCEDDQPGLLAADLDLTQVERVRAQGTEGINRMWSQFRAGETPVELPVYNGRMDPTTWTPQSYQP